MSGSATIRNLAEGVAESARRAKFCVGGDLGLIDPGLEIEGVPPIKFPLSPRQANLILRQCQIAPFGKGTQTLVDKKVRNTLELDPARFRLCEAWQGEVERVTRQAAEALGLPADRLEARLYKLLLYKQGGFFVPHRDSEKLDRMVASLIIALPSRFEGGRLIVRHAGQTQEFPFASAATGTGAGYAAFFADCEHEVQRVARGVRVCLAYNLLLKKETAAAKVARKKSPENALVQELRHWTARAPGEPLVFALDHHYTQKGLSVDLLKGADREMAERLIVAAEEAGCCLHLTQVSRHLQQFADDGSFGDDDMYWRPRRQRKRALEIGETYEDELVGTEWTSVDGTRHDWGPIELEVSSIVSRIPVEKWKPTSESFEGYTGNAGNTLDRWYHQSAFVIWHRDQHYQVLANAGPLTSIPAFCHMVRRLAKTAKKRLLEARSDALRFAKEIILAWQRQYYSTWRPARMSPPEKALNQFCDELLNLEDQETIVHFLSVVAERDHDLRLHRLIPAACGRFGIAAMAPALLALLGEKPERQEDPAAARDIEWLEALCCVRTQDADQLALGRRLCATMVDKFCALKPHSGYGERADERTQAAPREESLLPLLRATVAVGCEAELERLIAFVQQNREQFSLQFGQVAALKSLIPWSQKRLGAIPVALRNWLRALRSELESATAAAPIPPGTWTRPSSTGCDCKYCRELRAFLADPDAEIGRIAAAEQDRSHLIGRISQYRYDVTHTLERRGSPYKLVLKKTNGSYDREVRRYETNLKLLASLPEDG
ncbi:MAG: 2OG-Fe(II) oxygenase [Planctomycetales bacterium]